MKYYIIITMFTPFIWFSAGKKEFNYPILTILIGTFLGPVLVPIRLLLKLMN